VLTASTYPLEVAMAARWSEKNSDVKGSALEDAMQKQPWDVQLWNWARRRRSAASESRSTSPAKALANMCRAERNKKGPH
jgi:Protein of unknown function (DUF3300)